jgi:hypothetical protein
VRFFAQMPVVPVRAPPQDIDRAIRVHYSAVPDIPYGTGKAERLGPAPSRAMLGGSTPPQNELEASVADFVSTIVSDAHACGASDIDEGRIDAGSVGETCGCA